MWDTEAGSAEEIQAEVAKVVPPGDIGWQLTGR